MGAADGLGRETMVISVKDLHGSDLKDDGSERLAPGFAFLQVFFGAFELTEVQLKGVFLYHILVACMDLSTTLKS